MGAIRLTPPADADLTRLRLFMAKKSPRAAREAVERIISALDLLLLFPRAGVTLRGNVRQLYIKHGRSAYVARYMERGEDILILRLWHGKERR